MNDARTDLVVLVADQDMYATVNSLLKQPERLRIRPITFQLLIDREKHDPGCLRNGADHLRAYARSHDYGIIMFDRDGCGQEALSREHLEAQVEAKLAANGWSGRSATIVLDPELEAWLWSRSPHIDIELGWSGKRPDLRTWLDQQGLLPFDQIKPIDPKKALEVSLRQAKRPRSSDIYAKLASKVGFDACIDPAFVKLRQTLQDWFPRDRE